jgi:putative hemolysin
MHPDRGLGILRTLPALALLALAGGCAVPKAAPAAAAQRANPASENCVRQGGRLSIEQGPGGAEFGVCIFDDNRQCEEWALLRGACPAGGRRVTGYITAAARYCAISGGTYAVTARDGAADEEGSCTLPDGRRCAASAYFAGHCDAPAAR